MFRKCRYWLSLFLFGQGLVSNCYTECDAMPAPRDESTYLSCRVQPNRD
jgi:hypothetical protein